MIRRLVYLSLIY